MLVDVSVALANEPTNFLPIRGLIDTGATVSLLREEALGTAMVPIVGKRQILGVSGSTRFPETFCSLMFSTSAGPYVIEEFKLPVKPRDPDPNALATYDMLIGMDVIQQGHMTVDGPRRFFQINFRS